jgi:hypothetical protein
MNRFVPLLCLLVLLAGCAHVPPEAPQLSAELGKRISTLEDSHVTLLHRFFDQKREAVDRFIHTEWVPTFAENIFSDPDMESYWQTIVSEDNARDRLTFLIKAGTKLQRRINQKRQELMDPLDTLERRIEQKLRADYHQARAMNNSLTGLLASAAEVTENRQRYLEMAGARDEEIEKALSTTHDIVGRLTGGAEKIRDVAKTSGEYLEKIRGLVDRFSQL